MNQPQVHMCHVHPEPPLLPPCPPRPCRLSQRMGFGCPASYIKLALVIHFSSGNVYVSMLFSQITPPFPSSTESKSLFFMRIIAMLIIKIVLLNNSFNVFVFMDLIKKFNSEIREYDAI